ncbi:MAG TPA: helix-turn-helix domain-containing protein [Parvibaculum sp.]
MMTIMKGDATRIRIKLAARRLFAERGIDGVSIREIVSAAGQRNVGSLHYYFRTKEALVRELITDGAKLVNDRRMLMLRALEHDGGPRNLRAVIEILVWPSVGLGEADGEEDTYMRFIASMTMNHRSLLLDVLDDEWNSGYRQCVAHIETLLSHLPATVLKQRLTFMGIYLGAVMTMRETAFDRGGSGKDFWSAKGAMSNLIDTVQALLEGPVSVQTEKEICAAYDLPSPLAVFFTWGERQGAGAAAKKA